MIIDSHAHYAHRSFSGSFRFLRPDGDGYCISEGTRENIFREMEQADIRCSIEPGIALASNQEVLALCRQLPGRVFPAVGVHPTRTFQEKWRDRKILDGYARDPAVIAIGETGLDYHYPRKDQHRLCQIMWFLYQLRLAKKMGLPLILHIRDAHEDAIQVLKHFPNPRGGVVHCFNAGWPAAQQYLRLGYHLGIGGSLLQPEDRASQLWEAVRQTPLNRILIETDAPYILPFCKDTIKPKILRKTRNTSLILPQVIQKIAQLKGITPREVEKATAENAVRLFGLPVDSL